LAILVTLVFAGLLASLFVQPGFVTAAALFAVEQTVNAKMLTGNVSERRELGGDEIATLHAAAEGGFCSPPPTRWDGLSEGNLSNY
jgi:hypothetical protein